MIGSTSRRVIPVGLDFLRSLTDDASMFALGAGRRSSPIPRPFVPGADFEALARLSQRSQPRESLLVAPAKLRKQVKEARDEVDRYYGVSERSLPRSTELKGSQALPAYSRAGTTRTAFPDFSPTGKMNYVTMRSSGSYDPGYRSLGIKLPSGIDLKGADPTDLKTQLSAIDSDPQLRSQAISDMADNVVEAFNKAFSQAKSARPDMTPEEFLRDYAQFYQDIGGSSYLATGIYEPGLINAISGGFSAGSSPADELSALAQLLINPRYFPESARGAVPFNSAMRAAVSRDPMSFWHASSSGRRFKVPSYIRTREAKAQEALNRIRTESDNVVGDRHATDLALGMKGAYDYSGVANDLKRYGLIEDAFAEAGKRLGVDASAIQDVTWHWWRDLTLEQPSGSLPPVGRMLGDLLGRAGGRSRIDPAFRAPLEQRREMLASYRGLNEAEAAAAFEAAERYDALIRLAEQGGVV